MLNPRTVCHEDMPAQQFVESVDAFADRRRCSQILSTQTVSPQRCFRALTFRSDQTVRGLRGRDSAFSNGHRSVRDDVIVAGIETRGLQIDNEVVRRPPIWWLPAV